MTTTPKRKRRGGGRLGLVLLALVLIAVGVGVSRQRAQRALAATTESLFFTAVEGPLTISVVESGTIKPQRVEIIKSEIEGRTTILYLAPEGTVVKEGDLLVELDASAQVNRRVEQEIVVQNAEASFIQSRESLAVARNQAKSDVEKADLDLRFAREDLVHYLEGEFPNTLKEQEARITLAQEEFQRSGEKVKWSRVLFDENYLSQSELQADELSLKKAGLDVELARNNLSLLTNFTYLRRIAELESRIKQAEMAEQRVRRKADADVVQAESALRARESEFRQQTERLNKLNQQIAKARILAPRDGLVIYATSAGGGWRRETQPLGDGQEVVERQELIHLPTAATFIAQIKVHESNLEKIRTGLPVQIKIDALPGQDFMGQILTIAPLPDATSMWMNPDLKVYNVDIQVLGGGDVLRSGMSCEVEIIVKRHTRVLAVPVHAVVRVKGVHTVFVRTPQGVEPRTVQIGLDNNRMVHVIEGLSAGDQVLLAPPLEQADVPVEDAVEPAMPPPSTSAEGHA